MTDADRYYNRRAPAHTTIALAAARVLFVAVCALLVAAVMAAATGHNPVPLLGWAAALGLLEFAVVASSGRRID